MYACVYLYICVCGCTSGCMHVWHTWMGTCVSVLGGCVDSPSSLCFVACYSVLDPFGEIWTRYRRLELCPLQTHTQVIRKPIYGMIHRSVPVCEVKPDGDSFLKPRYFMWVFVLVYFFIYCCRYAFTCYSYHFLWPSDLFYQFDYLYHFMRHQWAFTFNYVADMSIFLRHFMCCYLSLLTLD